MFTASRAETALSPTYHLLRGEIKKRGGRSPGSGNQVIAGTTKRKWEVGFGLLLLAWNWNWNWPGFFLPFSFFLDPLIDPPPKKTHARTYFGELGELAHVHMYVVPIFPDFFLPAVPRLSSGEWRLGRGNRKVRFNMRSNLGAFLFFMCSSLKSHCRSFALSPWRATCRGSLCS
jgi:hypothetical protein